jgi:biopolymer transport protein ExbB/TolQ
MDPSPQPPPPAGPAGGLPGVPAGARSLLKRSLPGRHAPGGPGGQPRPAGLGDSPRPAVVSLSWEAEDIENRWGLFKGGRFTSVNKMFSFLLAAVVSVLFILAMGLLEKSQSGFQQLGRMFVRPGNLYATGPATLCFFWGLTISLLKIPKLRLQRRALFLAAVPQNKDFVLNETTAKTVLERVRSLVDDTKYFILLNRIDRALSNLRNIGGVSDVSTILKAQSENDENQVASSYAMIHAMIWSIPVLGFVGTVIGLSTAINKFTGALNATSDISQMRDQLKLVTAGLSTAFETTLVGLGFALLLHFASDLVQQKETDFLDECNDYCHANVVSKLRVRPKEGNPDPRFLSADPE